MVNRQASELENGNHSGSSEQQREQAVAWKEPVRHCQKVWQKGIRRAHPPCS